MTQLGRKNGKIAIIYCAVDQFPAERELECLADNEVEEVAAAVKAVFEGYGLPSDMLRVHPDHLDVLVEYTWIFNLAENVCGFDDLEYKIARGMENLGLHFTGSSAATLLSCQNKVMTKEKIMQHGLLTPAYTVVPPGGKYQANLTFPLFVKPMQQDGSIGIAANSQVCNRVELNEKMQEIHRVYRQVALVEEFIEGRDISAAVMGNGPDMQVLPLAEIVYQPAFVGPRVMTYEANWLEGSTAFVNSNSVCPCSLNSQTQGVISEMARCIYNILGCRDYARIDFRLRGDTPYVLEVNPNPCIHPNASGFVRACQAAGLDFSIMIYQILEQSMRFHAYATKTSYQIPTQ